MADEPSPAFQASQTLASIEKAAAEALLAKITAFEADVNAIVAGLDYAPGYVSAPKQIASGILSNIHYASTVQLPQLIAGYGPTSA